MHSLPAFSGGQLICVYSPNQTTALASENKKPRHSDRGMVMGIGQAGLIRSTDYVPWMLPRKRLSGCIRLSA